MAWLDTPLRRLLVLATMLLVSMVVLAQDNAEDENGESAETEAAVTEEAPEEEEDDLLDLEDPELDMQGFDPTADDDFIPTEEIPADQPIDFPTDI